MTKNILDDDGPFTQGLLRDTAVAANLPDLKTARDLLSAYEPRDAIEAMLASHLVAQQALLAEFSRRAAEPGLTADELVVRTDAVIRLDKSIRTAQRKLGYKPAPMPAATPVIPLDERLKAHFVDGGTSVH